MAAREDEAVCVSPADQFAKRFYDWEIRGRGWLLWDEPVEIEPPFRPFFGHYLDHRPVVDDGRKHNLISGLLDWVQRKFSREHSLPDAEDEPEEIEPDAVEGEYDRTEVQVILPTTLEVSRERAEQFLLSLSTLCVAPSFELVARSDFILTQFSCATGDAPFLRQQLEAHFPGVTASLQSGSLARAWDDAEGGESIVAELGLSREFMLPLGVTRSFAVDPLLSVAAALADVDYGEVAVLQVMFQPVAHPWAESVMRSVTFADGTAAFASGHRDLQRGAEEKVSRPLYSVVLRVACRASDESGEGRALELARRLVGALSALNNPEGNELIPLDNEGYDSDAHERDLLLRRSRRSGMLLSSSELVSLVHLPSSSVQIPKLRPKTRRTIAAPAIVLGHRTLLGVNDHAGEVRPVTLSPEQRAKHVHVIGASGTGKSTLLLNLIAQDLSAGNGVAVLDPHGDLIDEVLRHVPRDRVHDVILIDPSDEEFPVGFNVLGAHSALEKNLLASDLVAVFRRMATSWGDQMTSVLGNAILALLESEKGPATLVDLRRFLVEPAFRKRLLASVADAEVVYYWEKEFPLLTGRPQGPVLTRLDTFLRPKPIRHMVAQRTSRLDFADILDNGRILLARLSHGAIGAENAHLLGTLLVSKLHQLALGRQRMREEERRFFSLYIDEFHHFATPSMATILSGVRKYRLGLVLAHQEMQQLDAVPEVAGALMSNAYTRVCFRLGDADTRKLESGFAGFEASDLQNLGVGEAICRVERAELSFNLRTTRLRKVDEREAEHVRESVIEHSRRRYATPRAEVEATLTQARATPGGVATPPPVDTGSAQTEGEQRPAEEPPAPRRRRRQDGAEANAATPEANMSDAGARDVAPPHPVVPPPVPVSRTPTATAPATPPSAIDEQKRSRSAPNSARPLGRGGGEHQHLQRLIKQWAEGLGYRATIEDQVLGTRAADVALEKDGVSIAVELCVTTDFVHELGNVRKCLDAGFQHVVSVCTDEQRLAKLREVVEPQLEDEERERVWYFLAEQLFAFVQEIELQRSGSGSGEGERTVKGYRVRTKVRHVDGVEGKAKQQNLSDVIAKSIKRHRGDRGDKSDGRG